MDKFTPEVQQKIENHYSSLLEGLTVLLASDGVTFNVSRDALSVTVSINDGLSQESTGEVVLEFQARKHEPQLFTPALSGGVESNSFQTVTVAGGRTVEQLPFPDSKTNPSYYMVTVLTYAPGSNSLLVGKIKDFLIKEAQKQQGLD